MITKLVVRNVVSRPFRFLLTSAAVTLGVMFTVGVFVFTDSLRATFGDLADDIQSGFDLAVRSEIPFGERIDAAAVPSEVADDVAAVDGVAAVQPRVIALSVIPADDEGEPAEAAPAPNLGVNWEESTPNPRLFLVDDGVSRSPSGPGEFAMDIDAVADGSFTIGNTYTVTAGTGAREFELVGAFSFADPEKNALIGAKILAFQLETAVEFVNDGRGYDDITVVTEPGADLDTVIAAITDVIPDGLEVLSQEVVADEQAGDFDEFIDQFRTFLLVFAFIILLVSAFVIFNVFTILIGQRIRELGLLRALGASGQQVMRALLAEALTVGLFATAVGTALGIGLGWSLRWLLQQFDFGPEGSDLLLKPATFVWGVIVGIGVTLLSAVVPALRARGVPPMAALREDARLSRRVPAQNVALGASIIALGYALFIASILGDEWRWVLLAGPIAAFANVFGLRRIDARVSRFATLGFGVVTLLLAIVVDIGTGTVLVMLGIGAGTVFLGVNSISPMLARPAADFLGRWPLAFLLGVVGPVLVLAGAAATSGSLFLVVLSVTDLVTDFDFIGVAALAGSFILVALSVGLIGLGILAFDTALIPGWHRKHVIRGVFTFLAGAIATLLLLGGVAAVVSGESSALGLGIGGVWLIIVAVIVSTVAWWLRRPLPRRMNANGRMARENAARSPGRTASAAAALMIGLALVSTAAVVAESFKATFRDVLEDSVDADWAIWTGDQDPTAMFSSTIADDVQALPEIADVVSYRFALEAVRTVSDDMVRDSSATDLLRSLDHVDPQIIEIDDSLIGRNAAFVHEDFANDNGYTIGSTFDVEFIDQSIEPLTVAAIYTDSSIYGNRVIDLELWNEKFPVTDDQFVTALTADGFSEDAARAAIETVTDDFPQLEVQTKGEYQDTLEGQIDQALIVFTVLLLAAIVIALLGIAITLALSVFERTRELGLVRAVGMTTRQMMRMVLFEGVIIAVFGGVLGVGLGVLFGSAAVAIIPDTFVSNLAIPTGTLIQYLVLAAVAGVAAAIIPARRAARLDVLEAIAAE